MPIQPATPADGPKVSVVITAHNYGRYLQQSIDSVLAQTYDDWELVVVNDGSTDNSDEILKGYARHPKIHVLTLPGVGLATAANRGIRESRGTYVIRLDADDYFDENILLVLSNVLDRHPEYGMVFPDYYQVSQFGEVIDLVRQPKVNDEVKLLDRSALAAGALYRRSCYDTVGGYNEELRHQEDYDFWIRFIERFHVYNVQLPLMYYRRHGKSMSTATERRRAARRKVKRDFVAEARDANGTEVLCVLPIVRTNRYRDGLALEDLGDRPMMAHIIDQVREVPLFTRIIVDTEDGEIAEVARDLGVEVPFIRPRSLAKLATPAIDQLRHMKKALAEADGYRPDVIALASYNQPFIRADHMEEAVHSLLIHDCDSVISVGANLRYHWQPGTHGLTPVLYPRKLVNDQKWITYEERGGLYVLKTDNLETDNFLGESVSFIEIDEAEGLRVDSDYHRWVAERRIADYGIRAAQTAAFSAGG